MQGYKSFDDVVKAWYSEANGYSYNGGIDGAGHFTQIVSACVFGGREAGGW